MCWYSDLVFKSVRNGLHILFTQGSHRSLKTWNLKFWIPGLESPGIFVDVIESPGIWTYR